MCLKVKHLKNRCFAVAKFSHQFCSNSILNGFQAIHYIGLLSFLLLYPQCFFLQFSSTSHSCDYVLDFVNIKTVPLLKSLLQAPHVSLTNSGATTQQFFHLTKPFSPVTGLLSHSPSPPSCLHFPPYPV